MNFEDISTHFVCKLTDKKEEQKQGKDLWSLLTEMLSFLIRHSLFFLFFPISLYSSLPHAFLSFITPKNKGSPLMSPHKWMLFYVYRVILHLSSDKIITFQLISKRSDKETEVR